MNKLKMYQKVDKNFYNSIDISNKGISLPSYPDIKDKEVKYIANIIKRFLERKMNSKFLNLDNLKKIKFKKIGTNNKISKNITIIGEKNISIGSNVRIDDYSVISAGEGSLKIGSNVHIGAQSYLGCAGNVKIGNNVNISQGVRIYSKIDDYLKFRKKSKTILGSVDIGNNVVIGSGTVVIGKCIIAEGATVGALSLVKSNLRKWSINGGIPSKFIKARRKKI